MVKINNRVYHVCLDSSLERRFTELFDLLRDDPQLLCPVRGSIAERERQFRQKGFRLFPTVKRTTLLFDEEGLIFIKILHPIRMKEKALFRTGMKYRLLISRINSLSRAGIKIPEIKGHGYFKKGWLPFYIFASFKGRSLYDMVIRNSETIAEETIAEVIDGIAGLHRKGFYMGDAHLSHIFVRDGRFEGFIDIDGIRRVVFFRNRSFAKDLGYLNHPRLPFSEDLKMGIFDSYCEKMGIDKKERFMRLLKEYTEKRWKA